MGALSHSGNWRGVLCESMDQPQLADAQHRVALRLGGLTQDWRFDRMATVVHPATGKVTATFAPIRPAISLGFAAFSASMVFTSDLNDGTEV